MDFDGVKYVCFFLLCDVDSQVVIWQGLCDGIFDIFLFDYCFFCIDVIGKDMLCVCIFFKWVLNGIFGVEIWLLILFLEGVSKGCISL